MPAVFEYRGRAVAVVAVDGLFDKVGHGTSSLFSSLLH
jgi:hypothetical protein